MEKVFSDCLDHVKKDKKMFEKMRKCLMTNNKIFQYVYTK